MNPQSLCKQWCFSWQNNRILHSTQSPQQQGPQLLQCLPGQRVSHCPRCWTSKMLRSETHSTGTQHRKSSQGISLLAQALPPGAPFPQDVISLQGGGWMLLESWVFLPENQCLLWQGFFWDKHLLWGKRGVREAWWQPQIPQCLRNVMDFSIPLVHSQQCATLLTLWALHLHSLQTSQPLF